MTRPRRSASGLAQVDDQTEEIRERDKRYYEQQLEREKQQKEKEAETPTPEPAADPRDAEIEAFLADADRIVRDRNYTSETTEHYRVQTDDPRLNPVAAAALLESFQGFFDAFWAGRSELLPYTNTGRIFLFYSYFKYNRLLTGRERFGTFQPTGHYRAYFDVVVVHSDSVGPDGLSDVLVHEAAHQLLRNRLFGYGAEQSHWVAEGLASYFGYTQQDSGGEFVAGSIGGKGAVLLGGAKRLPEGQGGRALQNYRRNLKNGEAPAIAEIIGIDDPAVYYGEKSEANYAGSWLLVHYLFHGEDGARAEAFVRYLGREAKGEGAPEALYEEVAMTSEELDAAFKRYVLGLRYAPAKRRPAGAPTQPG